MYEIVTMVYVNAMNCFVCVGGCGCEWRELRAPGMDLRQTSSARTVARRRLEDSAHAVGDDSSTGEEEDAP